MRHLLHTLLLCLLAPFAAAAIRGTVLSVAGEPVGDARVAVYRIETPAEENRRIVAGTAAVPLAETRSDADGAFVLDAKRNGFVALTVEREGFAPIRNHVLSDDDAVVASLPTATARSGRVTAGGKPVSGAVVVMMLQSWRVWSTRTDGDGRYTLFYTAGGSTSIAILHPDYAPFTIAVAGTQPPRLDAVLSPGSDVAGKVAGTTGRPVAGARVAAGEWTTAVTGEDGAFALHHVAVEVKKIDAFDGPAAGSSDRAAKELVVRLEDRRSITGTVRDASQHPLPGTFVVAAKTSPPERPPIFAVADDKGNYRIEHAEAGEYVVYGFETGDLDFDVLPVSLRTTPSGRADLVARAKAYLHGIVIDEQKHPVAGAAVTYSVPQMPLIYAHFASAVSAITRSGKDGRFKLPFEKGTKQELRLYAIHSHYAAGKSAPIEDEGRASVEIRLPAGVELNGIVTDAAGKAVAGAGVVAVQDPYGAVPFPMETLLVSGMAKPFALTGDDGRFTLHLNAAPHDLGVWKEGYTGERTGNVTPVAGADPLKIVLQAGVELRGHISGNNKPLPAGGMVIATTEEELRIMAPVAPDGTFAFTAVRPGTYKLQYVAEGISSAERQAKAPAADVVLEVTPTYELHGRVIDAATQKTLTSYEVTANSGDEFESTTIDGAESFAIQLPAGPVELEVKAEGYVSATQKTTVAKEKPTEVTVALTRGRAVSGRITNESGTPIVEAWVSIEEPSSEISSTDAMTQTSAEGEYYLGGLPREALALEVKAKGYRPTKTEVAAGPADTRVDLVLTRGRSVSGHVVTSAGAPVEGANVNASGEPMQQAKTDASGSFTITGLGDGPYTFAAFHDELASEPVRRAASEEGELVLMMKPSKGAGAIHGTVRGFSGGAWQYGVVRASSGSYAPIGRDGTFRIERVVAGDIELRAWATSPRGDGSSPVVRVSVIANGDVEADLAFSNDVVVRGTVTEGGLPAVGRQVRFSDSGSGQWSARSGEDGRYEIAGLEAGRGYDVAVQGPRLFQTRVQVSGSMTFDIRIEWGTVAGRVVDANGVAIDGATIELVVAETKESAGETATDASGAFTLSVTRAPHVLTVVKKGFATVTQRVEAGAAPLVIRMVPADGLRVRLVDANDGRTLDGYVVAIDAAGLPVARAHDAEKGGAIVVPIGAGTYRIAVSADEYASQSLRASVPRQEELRIALTPGGTLIVHTDRAAGDLVKLILPNGEEYVRCQCNGIAEIRLTGSTTTIDHVAPGTFTMQVLDASGRVKTSYPVTIAEGKTTTAEIHVPE